MPWGVAAAVGGALISKNASDKASRASKNATDQQIAEERRQYDQTRQDQLPFLQTGYDALKRQKAYLDGDASGFQNSADYKFAVDQGFKGLNRGLARNGALWSGGGDADRIAFGQGLASQYANNYWSKLAQQAGQGGSTASSLGSLGANMAGNIGGALQANARAAGNSAYNNASSMNNLLGAGADAMSDWYNRKGGFYLGNQRGPG